ncbi:DNA replication and repair protein RecF, partial [bacterium]|nr:DNA replication and repair protein RecF [bacterium]
MKLGYLQLNAYRNCSDTILNFDKNKTLIIGKNAQGKTNILESIYFLSTLKTPRTSNLTELINFDNDFCKICAKVFKSGTDTDLQFIYTKDKKRELKINGTKSSVKDFKSVLTTVLFSSSDLLLLRGAPQDRRDWLDRAISQVYPAYDERLSKYDKIRIQKNNFLKECAKTGNFNEKLMDVFNEQLSISGSNIIYIRRKYLKEIEKIAAQMHKTISDSEVLSLKYDSSFLPAELDEIDIEKIQSAFKNSLEERKIEE